MTNTSHFDLNNVAAYEQWKQEKLTDYPSKLEDLVIEIKDPFSLTKGEKSEIISRCRQANMVIYHTAKTWDENQPLLLSIMQQLGVTQLDHNLGAGEQGTSSLTPGGSAYANFEKYIPYQAKAIGWHTDGYYNAPDRQIQTLTLYCQNESEEGGENDLLDHEIVYLLLRDKNPDYIRAFMQPDVMTIPARMENGEVARPDRTGPVFSIISGHLHMRYTARTKSISWQQDEQTQVALKALEDILKNPLSYKFQGKLMSGWGLISHNVLHSRQAFKDNQQTRKLHRARFYDRMN